MSSRVFLFTAALVLTLAGQARSQTTTPPPDSPQTTPPTTSTSDGGLLPEPRFVSWAAERFASFGEPRTRSDGFYVRFGDPMPGAGWLAIGPGYRAHLWRDSALVADVSSTVSWRTFLLAEGRLEMPELAGGRLTLGTRALWQDSTQLRYYGIGTGTRPSDVSEYRIRAVDASAYAIVRAGDFAVGARAGRLMKPELARPAGWNDRGLPATFDVFTDATAPGLAVQSPLDHADVVFAVSTLDHPGHPTGGGSIQAGAAEYRDRTHHQFNFRQYDLQFVDFIPVSGSWLLAVRLAGAAVDTVGANRVPFYVLPALGAQNEMRAFPDSRFRDRAVVAATIESRWALFPHLDAAVFADVGSTASTVRGLGPDRHSSYGVGLGFHTERQTVIRIDMSHGRDGWRLGASMSDPLTWSLLRRWATIIPIVP